MEGGSSQPCFWGALPPLSPGQGLEFEHRVSACSCLGSQAIFPPKAEVCPLFKQQHGLGLINDLFAVLVSPLGKHW